MNRRALGATAFVSYAALPVLANWMVEHVGVALPNGPHVIPVGFGLSAPSGVLCAGVALAMRDGVQELLGRLGATIAILVGAALSYAVAAQAVAFASGVAFLVSEVLDFLVYTPIRQQGRVYLAVLASNTVGLVADTWAFLGIAGFLSASLFAGQVVGKLEMTGLALVCIAVWMRLRPRVAADQMVSTSS